MTNLKIPRIEYLDVVKGIGILCVVSGHMLHTASSVFYLFHMPLFFFISGFLFSRDENQKRYVRNKLIQLIIPYCTFLILLYPFLFVPQLKTASAKEISLIFFRAILGGRKLAAVCTVFWFITCLWATQVVFNYLICRFSMQQILIISGIFLVFAYINATFFQNVYIPWNLNVVFFAEPVFLLGYLFKKYDFANKIPVWICIIFSLAGVYLSNKYPSISLNMKNAQYGIPVVSLFLSISIIISLFYIGKLICKVPLLKKTLELPGEASLVIMYSHQLIRGLIHTYTPLNAPVIYVICIIAGIALYRLLLTNKLLRIFFLGSKKDFQEQFERTPPIQLSVH